MKSKTVHLTRHHYGLSFFLFIVVAFSMTACFSTKSVEYRRIEQVELSGSSSPVISFNLILQNPNNWSVRLTEINSNVTVENRPVGRLVLPEPIRVKRNSEVTIPVRVELSTLDLLALLPTGLGLISDKKPITTGIVGDLTIKKFLFSKKYPFQYSQKVIIE
ncbi:MAG: LEA type 2 family protein [Bacteroidetes bacterium]|nr:LEA type 2 family protein [Bacteroidota bacterium]